MLVEIVAASPQDVLSSEIGGANRVELCSAMALGGLTPSFGMVRAARSLSRLPIMAMVRPRTGGFHYSEDELSAMEHDMEALPEAGANGFVFGVLTSDREIHLSAFRRLVTKAGGRSCVCHRAFDATLDPWEALEQLIDLGMTRILTSGHRETAIEGADFIRSLIERADGRIEILPGSGLRAENVREFVADTGATQVHLSANRTIEDASMTGVELAFNVEGVPENLVKVVDPSVVRAVVQALR